MNRPDGYEQFALDAVNATHYGRGDAITIESLSEDLARVSMLLQTFGRVLDTELARTNVPERTEVARG